MRFRFTRNYQLSLENSSLQEISQDINACIFDPKRPLLNKEVFITSTQFTPGSQKLEGIIHGMRHAMEAGVLGAAGYNLLFAAQKFSLHEYSPERRHKEIRCVQVGLDLHDSGREHDKEDIFELDSALNAYYYFTERLGVDEPTARKIAECILNKDWELGKKYLYLDGSSSLVPIVSMREKEPLRLAIHFGDCLEYLRIPNTNFQINHIKIYALYADSSPLIKDTIKKLIRETVKLIDIFRQKIADKNEVCNGPNALADILNDMQSMTMRETTAPVLSYFYQHGDILTSFNSELIASPSAPITEDPVSSAFYHPHKNHFLLLRMMHRPNQLFSRTKNYDPMKYADLLNDPDHKITDVNGKKIITKHYANARSRGEHELIKMFRNTATKTGNDWRSMSVGAPGSLCVGRSGFGILSSHVDICDVHLVDAWTGFGGKKNTYGKGITSREKLNFAEIAFKLNQLFFHMEKGGNENIDNEIEAKITRADCIVYTLDPSVFWMRRLQTNDDIEGHPLFALLEAIYLRDIYYKQSGIILPIYQISNVFGYCIQQTITTILIADAIKALLEIEFQKLCQMKSSCLKLDFLHKSHQAWMEALFTYPVTVSLMAYYEDDFRDQILKLITPTVLNQKKRLHQYVSQYQFQNTYSKNYFDFNMDMLGAKLSLGIEDAQLSRVIFCHLIELSNFKFPEKNKIIDMWLRKLTVLFSKNPDFFKRRIKLLIASNIISEDLLIEFKMLSSSGVLSDKQIHLHLLKRFETLFFKKVNNILDKNTDEYVLSDYANIFQYIFDDHNVHREYYQYFNAEMQYLFTDFDMRMKSIVKAYLAMDQSFFDACDNKKAHLALALLNNSKEQSPYFRLGKIPIKSERRFSTEVVLSLELVLMNMAFEKNDRAIWIEVAENLLEEKMIRKINITQSTINVLISLDNDRIFNILKKLFAIKISLSKGIDLNIFCAAAKVQEVTQDDIKDDLDGIWCLKILEDKVLVNVEEKLMCIKRNSMILRYLISNDSEGIFKALYYDVGKMLIEQTSSNLSHFLTPAELMSCYAYCDAHHLLESGNLLQRLKHHALFLSRDNPKVFFKQHLPLLHDLLNKHQNPVKRNLVGMGAAIRTDTMILVSNILNEDKSISQKAIIEMRTLIAEIPQAQITSTTPQLYQYAPVSSTRARVQY